MDSTQDATKPRTESKRAYSKPEVTDYGNVRELTRDSSTKTNDFHVATRQAV